MDVVSWLHAPYPYFVCGLRSRDPSRGEFRYLPVGTHVMQVEGEVERSIGGWSGVERRWTQRVEVRVVANINEAVPWRESAEMESVTKEAFVASVQGNDDVVMVWWSPRSKERVACGFKMQLLLDGAVIDSKETSNGSAFLEWRGSAAAGRDALGKSKLAAIRAMRVRISGNQQASIGMLDATWCWDGSVEFGLGELMDRWEVQKAEQKR